ncbi:hypothetical protein BDV24DRAFT_129509 [Aspergillus arachidicola]|uniref:Uncharacterized protein n=1 Tax=Aspergillus arachidicola TaxID=656916 RepID=A0A5N6YII3_9EURO|nr:hypothetical protein BDV24DRAFT_129509 [Aspergillus arachidicola]
MEAPSRQPINPRNRDQQRHSSFEKHSRDSFGDIVIMSLIQLHTMDLLSADPFSHAEVLYDQHLGDIESLLHGNDLEVEWPATLAPCQILVSGEMPWCKMRVILSRQSAADVNQIQSCWTQICSHNCGLRTVFRSDPRSGQMYQRVVYLTRKIEWDPKPIGSMPLRPTHR